MIVVSPTATIFIDEEIFNWIRNDPQLQHGGSRPVAVLQGDGRPVVDGFVLLVSRVVVVDFGVTTRNDEEGWADVFVFRNAAKTPRHLGTTATSSASVDAFIDESVVVFKAVTAAAAQAAAPLSAAVDDFWHLREVVVV